MKSASELVFLLFVSLFSTGTSIPGINPEILSAERDLKFSSTGPSTQKAGAAPKTRMRETYAARLDHQLPGDLIYKEGDVCDLDDGEGACVVHHSVGVIWDYFSEKHGRDSWDGKGGVIRATAYSTEPVFCRGFDGMETTSAAIWRTSLNQIQVCLGFHHAADIIAHEFTHGVIQEMVGEMDKGFADALNESFSNVFAVLSDPGDWTVGEDDPAGFLMNVCDPPTNPHARIPRVDHWDSRVPLESFLQEHVNSGIPDKAACLLSEGGTFRGVEVVGIGREKLGTLYYNALTRIQPDADFFDAKQAIAAACVHLAEDDASGFSTQDCLSVDVAFEAVGIVQDG